LNIFERKIQIFIYILLIRLSDLVFSGTITYSLINTDKRLKFRINSTNGIIVTTQVLDRDEPAGEKEANLVVLAIDNGKPQLSDICTFKVTVLDTNDNGPIFNKAVRR